MGPSQHHLEEGRVTLRFHPALLLQEKHQPGGWQQIDCHVLQEGTQGLIIDPQAHHEEP
jgi:hypothetical protein